MVRIYRAIGPLLLLIALAACATTARFEEQLSSWVGQPIDRMIATVGIPDNSVQLHNGNTIYEWSSARGVTTVLPSTGQILIQSRNRTCSFRTEVNPEGTIVAWGYNGDDCRA